jgi:hypothetical protein
MIKFLTFATALADAAKDADTVVVPDHVVDHLRQQHSLADSGATEQTSLAASLEWNEHVYGLDAGLEDFRSGGALRQGWGRPMHRSPVDAGQVWSAVNRVAEYVEHPGKQCLPYWRF